MSSSRKTTTTTVMRLCEADGASYEDGTTYCNKSKKYYCTLYDADHNSNDDDTDTAPRHLPPEVLRHITGYVNDPRTAGRLAQTNRAWSHVVTHHPTLWQNLAQARWKLHPIIRVIDSDNDSSNDSSSNEHTSSLQFRQHYKRRHISDHRVRVLLQTLVRQMLSLHLSSSNNNNRSEATAFGLVYGWHWGSSFWRRLVEGLLAQQQPTPDDRNNNHGHCFAQALDVARDMARQPQPTNEEEGDEEDVEDENDDVPAARLLLPRLTRCVATHVLDTLHTAQIQAEWRQRVVSASSQQQQGSNDNDLLEEGAILLARSLVPPAALVLNNDNEEDDLAFGLGPSITRQLDEWAAQLQKRLNHNGNNNNNNHNALTAVQTLTQLFGLQGCTTEDDYYHVRHSSLASVLQTRRGIPITLAVVYKLVLRRCNIDSDVSIVGLPGHVVLGCGAANGGEPTHFVDVFHGGRVLTVRDCMDLVHLRGFPWSRRFLQPLPAGAVLRRMLNNLQHGLGREFHRRPPRVRTVIQLERTQQLQLALQQPQAEASSLDGGDACPELTLDPDIFFQHGLIDAATAERCHQASIARAFQEP